MRKFISVAEHHFHLLGVHRQSAPDEITAARNALLRAVHPDRAPDENVLEAGRFAALVNAAADVLVDKKRAARYLAELATGRCTCPSCRGAGAVRKQNSMKDIAFVACPTCKGCGLS